MSLSQNFSTLFWRKKLSESIVNIRCNPNQKSNCAILLDYVVCDGYLSDKKIGIFSHFHADHIGAITKCIDTYDILLTHNTTHAAIAALEPGLEHREQWRAQDYDTEYHINDIKIRLLNANHIPGSSQIYIQTKDTSMLYSGDFSYPGMQIRQAEYLVLDATHGDPSFDGRTDRISVVNRLCDDVRERTTAGRSIVVYAVTGTLQEIVKYLDDSSARILDNVCFVMDEKHKEILYKIYGNNSDNFRHIIDYDSPEFWRNIRERKPCIIFKTPLRIPDERFSNFYKIFIDRYGFTREIGPIIQFSNDRSNGCRYNLASHASIDNIYAYIEAVNPKYVITDHSRSNYAPQLAKMIRQKFTNITTKSLP